MIVRVAGYNIDKSLIDTLDPLHATPEVISAAYARISRSKKTVTELREGAINEVEKARKSNNNIIFEMGHSSIAEHVVFNFDLLDVSRYLAEFIQKSRLASFTEKSQRYVTFDSLYIVPKEISQKHDEEYRELMDYLFESYNNMYELAKQRLKDDKFEGRRRELEGKAKEDARYILPLSTLTQMGMTINARNLEHLLKRLDKSGLDEALQLKEYLYNEVAKIAPSVIKYIDAESYDFNKLSELKIEDSEFDNQMISCSSDIDTKILSHLYFEEYGGDYQQIYATVSKLSNVELEKMYSEIFVSMKGYHLPPKAFEVGEFEFTLDMSSSCFAQLKRHRMSTIIKSPYNQLDGYVIPPQIIDLGLSGEFSTVIKRVNNFAKKVDKNALPYVLTNSHKVRVLFKANLREIYHFVRLRSDEHAQWEIQNISNYIMKIVKEHAPLSSKMLGGKSSLFK